MSAKYYVKPVAPAISTKGKTISPPASSIKQRIPSAIKAPSRPSSDTHNSESPAMNRGPTTRPIPTRPVATATKVPATKGPVPRGPPTGGRTDLVPCKICGRNFAPDRVQAHAEICAKTARKKRKPFDVAKQRVKGTDIEAYTRKGRTTQPPPKSSNSKMLQSLSKSNWRRKHEEFIANIRAAKEAQAHVAKGGKLSDLPPPPPMDTSDLIPCPHCKRKFNEAAAERHIPKCAQMQHNKPKPVAAGASSRAKPTTKRY